MSTESWTDLLKQMLTSLEIGRKRPLRIALVGIGHELRGDDAAGLVVAERLLRFAHERFLVVEGGHAPENHTGSLRRFGPDLVVLVDAAYLNERPGTIRWLPWQETTGLSASTHTMPPYMLARYLTTNLDCEVVLLGVQPADTSLDAPMTLAVATAVDEVVAGLKASDIFSS